MLVVGGGKLLVGMGDILFGSFVIGVLEVWVLWGVVGVRRISRGRLRDFGIAQIAGTWAVQAVGRARNRFRVVREGRICLWCVRGKASR